MIKIFGFNINKDKFIVFLLIVNILLLFKLVYFVKFPKKYNSEPMLITDQEVEDSVKIYLEPREVQLVGSTPIKIVADSGGKKIAFARVVLMFNPANIQLHGDIVTNPIFSTIVEKTDLYSADVTGKVTFVIASGPNDVQPSGIFELATINFFSAVGSTAESQIISLAVSDMQIVDSKANSVKIIPSDGILMLDKNL